jgi:hypothetical protein
LKASDNSEYNGAMIRSAGIAVLVAGASAWGMSVHETSTSLAHSADGQSELFEDDASGPEGGGSTTYRVTGPGAPQRFVISSDFSPGDSSRPQTVTEKVCRDRLADLRSLLDKRGFKGVAIHPEVCAQKPRLGAVTAP